MKILNIKDHLSKLMDGEFIIGSELTGSHACYMIYGVIEPAQKERLIKPGKGHEEIVLILKGKVKVTGNWQGVLNEGEALHIKGEETLFFENISDSESIYIIAGGHSEEGHSH